MNRSASTFIAHILLAIIAACLLTACSEASFRLSGSMSDVRDQTLRLVIYDPDGVRTEALATREGKFEYKGKLRKDALPSYVEIYSHDYKLLGIAAVAAGHDVDVVVDPKELLRFRAVNADSDGPQFNTQLTDWLKATAEINDSAIAAFVKSHPASVVSLALLSALYDSAANPRQAYDLLKSLEPTGRPAYYDNGFLTLMQQFGDAADHIVEGTMYCSADTMFNLTHDKYRAILIAFTQENDEVRGDSVVPTLSRLAPAAKSARKLVLEHSLAQDTLTWKKMLQGNDKTYTQNDTTNRRRSKAIWPSVWTGPGPAANYARDYAISAIPYYIVADSTGAITYRGTSASAASRAFNK